MRFGGVFQQENNWSQELKSGRRRIYSVSIASVCLKKSFCVDFPAIKSPQSWIFFHKMKISKIVTHFATHQTSTFRWNFIHLKHQTVNTCQVLYTTSIVGHSMTLDEPEKPKFKQVSKQWISGTRQHENAWGRSMQRRSRVQCTTRISGNQTRCICRNLQLKSLRCRCHTRIEKWTQQWRISTFGILPYCRVISTWNNTSWWSFGGEGVSQSRLQRLKPILHGYFACKRLW